MFAILHQEDQSNGNHDDRICPRLEKGMSILGMNGFESYEFTSGTATVREDAADLMERFLVLSGDFDRSATVPPGSPSLWALAPGVLDIVSLPWWDDSTTPITRNEPSDAGGAFWFHGQARLTGNSTSNDGTIWGISSDDAEYIALSWENNTSNVTLRIAGVVRATSSYASGIVAYTRYMVEVSGFDTGDTVNVYVNGDLVTPIITYSLIAGDALSLAAVGTGKANGFYVIGRNGPLLDDLWAMDHLDGVGATDPSLYRDSGIRGQVATGDGTPTNWTPSTGGTTFDDIDLITDADFISTGAAGTVSEVSKGAVAGSAERIGAVKVYANVTQSDVTAGTKIGLGFDDGVAPVQKDSLVPATGYVTNVYDVAPGAVDWTPAIYDASDIKIISVA